MLIGTQLCHDFLQGDNRKTGFLIQCWVIPRSAAVDVLKAASGFATASLAVVNLSPGLTQASCLFFDIVWAFSIISRPSATFPLGGFFKRRLHFSISQWHKLCFCWRFFFRDSRHEQAVPIFVFVLFFHLRCIPLGSVDMAIRE